MAEDVIKGLGSATPVEPVVRPEPSRAERARHSAYRGRFILVYLALAIVLGSAIGALAVALRSSSSTEKKPQTRVFSPSAAGELGAIELADRVQRLYRGPNGRPLVDVIASRNTLQDGNLGLLRVRFQVLEPVDALGDRDSQVLRPGNAIQFSLCGSGAQCTIPGTASAARGVLLRREGLELALRTFATDVNVDNIVVFLRPVAPPEGSSYEGYVLMFNRNLLGRNDPALLLKPVAVSLPGAGSKITAADVTPAEAARIDELTRPYLYLYRYQLIGGHDALMQLEPASN